MIQMHMCYQDPVGITHLFRPNRNGDPPLEVLPMCFLHTVRKIGIHVDDFLPEFEAKPRLSQTFELNQWAMCWHRIITQALERFRALGTRHRSWFLRSIQCVRQRWIERFQATRSMGFGNAQITPELFRAPRYRMKKGP